MAFLSLRIDIVQCKYTCNNNRMNAHALIGQSAMVYFAGTLVESFLVFLKCYYDNIFTP